MNSLFRFSQSLHRAIWICLLLSISACSTMPSGRGWGEDVSLTNWHRIKLAAVNAVTDPETWVPLAGAAVFSIDELDEDTSDWLSEETPIFGSNDSADDASDYLKETLTVLKVGTALATPSGETAEVWLPSKLKGLAVMVVASKTVSGTTDFIKEETDRRRPDDSDDLSFPSGHTSSAYASSTLASRNVNSLDISDRSRRHLRYGFKGLAAATAWARVEAKRHYPSDVLFAAAMSHFLSAFIHDAFMGLDSPVSVSFAREEEGLSMQFGWRF